MPQLEKSPCSKKDPAQPKIKKQIKKINKKKRGGMRESAGHRGTADFAAVGLGATVDAISQRKNV